MKVQGSEFADGPTVLCWHHLNIINKIKRGMKSTVTSKRFRHIWPEQLLRHFKQKGFSFTERVEGDPYLRLSFILSVLVPQASAFFFSELLQDEDSLAVTTVMGQGNTWMHAESQTTNYKWVRHWRRQNYKPESSGLPCKAEDNCITCSRAWVTPWQNRSCINFFTCRSPSLSPSCNTVHQVLWKTMKGARNLMASQTVLRSHDSTEMWGWSTC